MLGRPFPKMARQTRSQGWRRAVGMVLPVAALVWAAATGRGEFPLLLAVGSIAGAILVVAWMLTAANRTGNSRWLTLQWALAAIFLWLGSPTRDDPYPLCLLGLLVLGAVSIHSWHTLQATGSIRLRQARQLARRLAQRRHWPDDLDSCRRLPEVRSLREAARDEAGPVLALLSHSAPQVRIAGLAALEFRRDWRVGQPDRVLELVKSDPHPEIRAAALLALGGTQQRLILEEMATSLRDPSPVVRQAAVDALLWDCERRWIWVRHAVHEALGDPRLSKDGPIELTVGRFSDAAAADLVAWTTEAGSLGLRATQTLARHYGRLLSEREDPKLYAHLTDLVLSVRTSAILRIELAHLLRQHQRLTTPALEQLLDPANPSTLRLLAVETLLQSGPHPRAIETLRDVARHPNRELALQAAAIVQRSLHVDMGLAIDQPLPPLHTRQAAEVTRRVIQWAEQKDGRGSQGSSLQLRPSARGSDLRSRDSLLSRSPAPRGTHSVPPTGENPAPLEWD